MITFIDVTHNYSNKVERMLRKVLFVSNTANFSKFNRPFMRWFKQQGWQVDYASLGEEHIEDCDNQYSIPIARTPYSIKNIWAYLELKKILQNNYEIVHCHTPMGGFLARMAARGVGSKVVYTVHGFHFYKGAPLFNWLVYYPIERYLTRFTDAIITINDEDYDLAKRKHLGYKYFYKINGVGVDLNKFRPRNSREIDDIRTENGYYNTDFIIIDVAEINKNKNQIMLIRALPELLKYIQNIKVLLVGKDNYPGVKSLCNKLNLRSTVKFLGYRKDVEKLFSMSNLAFSASLREGLPINVVEAMASKVPVVCSKNRGHNSLIVHKVSGLLFSPISKQEMVECILAVYNSPGVAEKMASNALQCSKKYDVVVAVNKMANIYNEVMALS
jgi:glycosyltransferase EpsD